jgi:hypothetical protein
MEQRNDNELSNDTAQKADVTIEKIGSQIVGHRNELPTRAGLFANGYTEDFNEVPQKSIAGFRFTR